MKKQILAAAVAATFAVPAMADIYITGGAKYEYKNTKDNSGATEVTSNTGYTEASLDITGKSGASTYVMGTTINNASNIVMDNMYLTTKIGPVGVKAGDYSSGTSGLLGEIENGDRSHGKITLDYSVNGIKFYAGNGGAKTAAKPNTLNSNMFAGVQATVEGWKLQLKMNNENKNSFGVSGTAGPVGVRFEYANDSKADKNTGYFLHLTSKLDNINVGLAYIAMDKDGGITEDDSSIFAVSNAGAGNSNMQVNADITVDGTTYGAAYGIIDYDTANGEAYNYYKVFAKRTLDSGVTANVSYTGKDRKADTLAKIDSKTFEVDLSVKF